MLAHSSRRVAGRVARTLAAVQRDFKSSAEAGQAHPKPVPLSKLKDSFLDGTSSTYLEELEQRYREDPASVDRTWASFFKSMGGLMGACMAFPRGGSNQHAHRAA